MGTTVQDGTRASVGRLIAKQMTGVIGAEVSGLNVREALQPHLVEQFEQLIYEFKVLVLRDQHGVTPSELLRFAEQFGAPEVAPHPSLASCEGEPGVKIVAHEGTSDSDNWHTDGATRENPRWLTFLQAIDIPPYGRDTILADMEAVFEGLSPPLQQFLTGMTGLHSWGDQDPHMFAHPLVVDNPVTGRRAVYVSRLYARALKGLHPKESDLLLDYLLRRAEIPKYHARVVWQPGTIVVWDNQRTQHYAVQDVRYNRVLHRVMVQPS